MKKKRMKVVIMLKRMSRINESIEVSVFSFVFNSIYYCNIVYSGSIYESLIQNRNKIHI